MHKPHTIVNRVLAPSPGSADHLCVDNVRYWSMFAIVAVHSVIAWGIHSDSRVGWEIQIGLLQALKFGTIGFYLISGFLLGLRVDRRPPHEYFLRRLRTVGLPWVIWVSIFAVLPFAKPLLSRAIGADLAEAFGRHLADVLLFSPYWFVPNFFIALALLLLLRRYLDDVRTGIALLTVSLFYGVNIYGRWIPANHTYAVFGFVFYLWLGSWASRHSEKLLPFLERIPPGITTAAILVTGTFSLAEAHLLHLLHAENIVNTLRVTNQLFSVVVVVGLIKLRRPTWPSFVNVRAHTFGLYLVHPVCMFILARGFDLAFHCVPHAGNATLLESYTPAWAHPWSTVLLWTSMFALCYGISLVLVKTLFKAGLSWVVGRANSQPKRPQSHRAAPVIELKPAA